MKKALLSITVVTLLVACGSKQTKKDITHSDAISTFENLPGDSARYGLACDGCTDSIVVFLPYSGGDPDTFDIIKARQNRQVLGRPHIGDAIAVIVDSENPKEANRIINLSRLEGIWCYMVEPTLRTIDGKTPPIPDSIKKKILVAEEYNLRLKSDFTASATGHFRRSDDNGQSLSIYPEIHRYTDWRLFNGHLILHADTIAGFTKEGDKPIIDTAEIILLMRDSLILRFGDTEQSYYRKKVQTAVKEQKAADKGQEQTSQKQK